MAFSDRHAPRARATKALFFFIAAGALGAYAGCSSSPTPAADGDAGIDAAPFDASTVDTSDPSDAPPQADAELDAEDANFDCTSEATDDLPHDLRCTGLYSDWATKTVASSARAYAPGYQLWSDGAIKSRWIYLPGSPPDVRIDTANMDEWTFPVGTKVWKEFKLGDTRIETRMFWKRGPSDWAWTTYRWSADEKTAVRLDTGEQNVNATTYEIPSHSQCSQCHGGRLDKILGFDAVSLGGSLATGFKLDTLVAQGWLTSPPATTPTIPEDASGNARVAIGWLHANCGTTCHNANIGALAHGTGLHMRVNVGQVTADGGAVKSVRDLDTYITAVNVVPNMSPFSTQGYMRIKPGDVSKSLIPTLDGARNDPNVPQMPPIISHQVDMQGLTAVKNWIATMNPDGG
jgi:hypothetical protein